MTPAHGAAHVLVADQCAGLPAPLLPVLALPWGQRLPPAQHGSCPALQR